MRNNYLLRQNWKLQMGGFDLIEMTIFFKIILFCAREGIFINLLKYLMRGFLMFDWASKLKKNEKLYVLKHQMLFKIIYQQSTVFNVRIWKCHWRKMLSFLGRLWRKDEKKRKRKMTMMMMLIWWNVRREWEAGVLVFLNH